MSLRPKRTINKFHLPFRIYLREPRKTKRSLWVNLSLKQKRACPSEASAKGGGEIFLCHTQIKLLSVVIAVLILFGPLQNRISTPKRAFKMPLKDALLADKLKNSK